jgi:hypothetical protein
VGYFGEKSTGQAE